MHFKPGGNNESAHLESAINDSHLSGTFSRDVRLEQRTVGQSGKINSPFKEECEK